MKKVPLSTNPYLYGHADPINQIDPSGFMTLAGMSISMPMISMASIGTAFITTVRIISASVGIIYVFREIYLTIVEDEFSGTVYALTPEQEAQKQTEYDIMKKLSQMPPDPRNDCSGLAAKIHHAQAVLERYKAWDAKWFPGRHAQKIQDWEKRLDNLKNEHNKKCTK
jgi:type VI secretion system secreted protein VgrG